MFKSLQKETKNNIVFLSAFGFLIFFTYFGMSIPFYYGFSFLVAVLLIFGAFLYGLYSKNLIKSILFGFFLSFLMIVLSFFESGYDEMVRAFVYLFILSIAGSVSGGFAALATTKSDKGVFFLFIALFFLFIQILYFASGIN
jgi:hypothetical protein